MPKRFTATEKWTDPWFCGLSLADRMFWIYLLDMCDHAGVWQVNWPLVRFYIPGYEFNPEKFEDRIVVVSPSKWFIPKFLEFQYGELTQGCKPHQHVVALLRKHGLSLSELYPSPRVPPGYQKGSPTLKDKDKDKDKEGDARGRFAKPSPQDVAEYARGIGFELNGQEFCDHYESKGWVVGKAPMKNWKACVRTWKTNHLKPMLTSKSNTAGGPDWMKS